MNWAWLNWVAIVICLIAAVLHLRNYIAGIPGALGWVTLMVVLILLNLVFVLT